MRKTTKGSALLTALFIMTLIAIASTAMMSKLQLDIYRTRMMLDSDKRYLAAQLVVFWAKSILSHDPLYKTAMNHSGKVLDFPASYKGLYPGVIIRGELDDLQARYNLNNVRDPLNTPSFERLLKKKVPSLDKAEQGRLTRALRDWIMPSPLAAGENVWETYYLKQHPPYLAPHQLMVSVSELNLILGFNQAMVATLSPNVTVLPENTTVNINTAMPVVLSTLGKGLKPKQVETILDAREHMVVKEIGRINDFLSSNQIDPKELTAESQYFLVKATVSMQNTQLTVYTVLYRIKQKNKYIVKVIRQSLA